MLNSTEVNLGQLLLWAGLVLGVLLVVAGDLTKVYLMTHIGLIVVGLACTHAIQRSFATRDETLREAYECGHKQGRAEAGIHSLR